MKRIAKFLRSRFFLGAICIILEVIQLWAVFLWLYEVFLPISIVGWVLYVGVLLYLINRDEIPEIKLLWLVIMLIMPLIGAFVLLLVSGNHTSKRYCKRYEQELRHVTPYLQQGEDIKILDAVSREAALQATYLYNAAAAPCWAGTNTTYFPLGEDFHAALLADLQEAKQFIFMEYFIIQGGKMWDSIHRILKEKAAQSVEVYVMYDDLGCIATLPAGYYELLRAEGIHCVPSQKFNPIFSHIHNNRDHRKITVIDGHIGYTGGINLADEYINAIVKHGHWKDTAVRLEGAAVRNLSALFIAHWNAQRGERIDPNVYLQRQKVISDARGYVIPFGDGPSPIYRDEIGKNVYINMANGAKDYLYITTPYLICDYALLSALSLAAKKGVDVRLITPHIPDKKTIFLMTRSSYQTLLKDGVKIYEYTPGFVHAKNFLCDDAYAVCGTINLDYRSLVHHFECGAWMYGTACIQDMKQDFIHMLSQCRQMTQDKVILRGWQQLVAGMLKLLSPLL